MCQFLSKILTRKGQMFGHWGTDHHEDLISIFGLSEGKNAVVQDQNFIRLEFSPAEENGVLLYSQPSRYSLKVDEEFTPEWFDKEMREKTIGILREEIERMIVRDSRKVLVGGTWIIAKGAMIEKASQCRLLVSGGTVQTVDSGGTVQTVDSGGTVQTVYSGGTVQTVYSGGTVQTVYSGGTVQTVYSGGTVQTVDSGGTVQTVYSGGTVQTVYSGALINGERK